MRISTINVFLLALGTACMANTLSNGQGIESTEVELEITKKPLTTVFKDIEAQTDFMFWISPGIDVKHKVTLAAGSYTVRDALELVLRGTDVKYEQNGNYVLVFNDEATETVKNEKERSDGETHAAWEIEQQQNIVTGTVKSAENNEPLAGVNIIVKGTTRGTTTDQEGKFGIEAKDDDVLVFSFIGLQPFETNVGGRTVIDALMEVDVTALKEVVVNAGYYQVKKHEQTGNISRISAKEIHDQPVSNPLETLHGRVPGVYISQNTGVPGSTFDIKIRGRNSLRSDANDPLIVIDGVPFSSQSLSSSINTGGILGIGTSPLNSLNTADIESIEILKDADATAIYGSRGANGVILITTKKGNANKPQLDVNFNQGFGRVTRMLKMLNTPEYLEMRREAYQNDGVTGFPADAYDVNGTWDQNRYTDWQDVLIGGTASLTNAQVSLSGGGQETQFLASGGYQKQTTVFPGDYYFRKISTHFSLNHISTNKKLQANASVSYVADKNHQPFSDFASLITLAPNAPELYNEDGSLNWENSTWSNPLRDLGRSFFSNTNNLLGNIVISYEVLPGLKIRNSLGLNNMYKDEGCRIRATQYFDPKQNITSASSYAMYTNGNVQSWIAEPAINWQKVIRKGEFDVLIGSTFQEQNRKLITKYGANFPSDALINNSAAASTQITFEDLNSEYKYNGVYGRVNYSLLDRYIINLTGRRDGSSRFGPGRQFANFGAVGAAWIFSNESFIKNSLGFISFGKLRASYGTTGNDQIGDYQFLDTYTTSSQYEGIVTLKPSRLHNSDLAWEVNKKMEGGLDLEFMNDRLAISLSYYRNESSGQLVNYTLPATTGFSGIVTNLDAVIQNKGLEVEVNSINIRSSGVTWSSSFNFTLAKNKLVEFPGLTGSSYQNSYVIGESLNIRKGFVYDGVNPETGLYEFVDVNGDGQISRPADQNSVLRLDPKFYGGVNNTLAFKGVELSFFIQFVKKDNVLSLNGIPGTQFNQPSYSLDRWQQPGDEARFMRFTTGVNAAYLTGLSQYINSNGFLVDGSFARLKNVTLSYTLPEKFVKKIKARFYIQGQNLITVTKYEGIDPEVVPGLRVPPLKVLTIGGQITL